jgi:hypothetical protein
MEFSLEKWLSRFILSIVRKELATLFPTYDKQKQLSILTSETEISDSRIGWKGKIKTLREAHKLLIQYGYISCRYPCFQLIFYGVGFSRRIMWLKSTESLSYFFDQLRENKLTAYSSKPYKILSEKFFDMRGNIPTPDGLRSSLNSVKNGKKEDDVEEIDEIISALNIFNKV